MQCLGEAVAGRAPLVFNEDLKQIRRMAPLMQRVLIVDPTVASARLLTEVMRNIVQVQVWHAPTTHKGMEAARQVNPQLVFAELAGPDVDGVEFSRQLRRSHLACRQAPIIMVTATATAGGILAARDAGVHEFLRKPYTAKDLLRRLEAVTLHPRDWIEAVEYVGPDRRRFNSADYKGPLKRRSDADATPEADRITQALRIVRAAIPAITADPSQAMRALLTQMVDLHRCAVATGDAGLLQAVSDFQRYLAGAAQSGALNPVEMGQQAAPLLAFLPNDAPGKDQAA